MRLTPAFLCLALTLVGPIAIDGAPVPVRRAAPETADLTVGQQQGLADVQLVPSLSKPHVGADINPCKANLLGLVGPECRQASGRKNAAKGVADISGSGTANSPLNVALVNPGRGLSASTQPSSDNVHSGGRAESKPMTEEHRHRHHNEHNSHDEGHRDRDHRHGSGNHGKNHSNRGSHRNDGGHRQHSAVVKDGHAGSKPKSAKQGYHKTASVKASTGHGHPSVLLDLDASHLVPVNQLTSGVLASAKIAPSKVQNVKHAAENRKGRTQDAIAAKQGNAKSAQSAVKKVSHAKQDKIANGGVIDCSSHGGLAALTSLNINSCNGANGGNNVVGGSVHKSTGGLLDVLHRRQADDATPQDDGQAAAESEEEGEEPAAASQPETDEGENSSTEGEDEAAQEPDERFFVSRSEAHGEENNKSITHSAKQTFGSKAHGGAEKAHKGVRKTPMGKKLAERSMDDSTEAAKHVLGVLADKAGAIKQEILPRNEEQLSGSEVDGEGVEDQSMPELTAPGKPQAPATPQAPMKQEEVVDSVLQQPSTPLSILNDKVDTTSFNPAGADSTVPAASAPVNPAAVAPATVQTVAKQAVDQPSKAASMLSDKTGSIQVAPLPEAQTPGRLMNHRQRNLPDQVKHLIQAKQRQASRAKPAAAEEPLSQPSRIRERLSKGLVFAKGGAPFQMLRKAREDRI